MILQARMSIPNLPASAKRRLCSSHISSMPWTSIQDLEPTGWEPTAQIAVNAHSRWLAGLWRLLKKKPVRSIPSQELRKWHVMPLCDAPLHNPPDACGKHNLQGITPDSQSSDMRESHSLFHEPAVCLAPNARIILTTG